MYREIKDGFCKHLDFAAVDLIALSIALCISCSVYHYFWQDIYFKQLCAKLFVSGYIGSIVSAIISKNYDHIVRRYVKQEIRYVICHTIEIIAFMMVIMISIDSVHLYSLNVILLFAACNIIMGLIARTVFKRYLIKKYKDIDHYRSIVMIAQHDKINEMLDNLTGYKICSYHVTGIICTDDYQGPSEIRGIPVIHEMSDAMTLMKRQVIDEIIVGTEQIEPQIKMMIDICYNMGIAIHYIEPKLIQEECEMFEEHLGEYAVTTVALKSVSQIDVFMKRLLDIMGGMVGLIFTGIILLFVTPIVKIQSPGPILFSQIRVGKNGRKFRMYKIRTMYTDAEERKKELMANNEMQGLMFKMKNDPRIFPFGKFLRKTSLDEFPQFWNVLKGNMSLVGTRPPTVDEYEQYDVHHKSRLATRPGLTGLWQVSGRSGITDFEEVVALDTQYIQNWSVRLDIKILFKTVLIVFYRSGAE